MTSSPSSFTRQFIASAWACSTITNSVYIFLDHPVPAKKHRRRQRCLFEVRAVLTPPSPRTRDISSACVCVCARCELHAACRASAQQSQGSKHPRRSGPAIICPSSPERDNPNASNTFFTPSPVWGSPIKEIPPSDSPNTGHCYAISSSSTHESRRASSHPPSENFGHSTHLFPSPLRAVVSPPPCT